jgi:hypothetical protein
LADPQVNNKWHVVFPQPPQRKISNHHSPLDRLTPTPQNKKKLNNKQAIEKKGHIAKMVGCPEL